MHRELLPFGREGLVGAEADAETRKEGPQWRWGCREGPSKPRGKREGRLAEARGRRRPALPPRMHSRVALAPGLDADEQAQAVPGARRPASRLLG